jgi:hypothetical protein
MAMLNRRHAAAWAALAAAALAACGAEAPPTEARAAPGSATPKAACGPGSRPETGLQGRVSRADHDSGRAAEGFACNAELVGSYTVPNAMGTVGGFKVERYTDAAAHDCAYYDTTLLYPTNVFDLEAGVNVLDMTDPAKPAFVKQLVTPAMLSPHESLVLSKEAGVLAAVTANPAFYPGVVDVYDISADCRDPQLRYSAPLGFLGHESGIAPDGRTFYSASPGTPTLTAVDISDPTVPKPLWTGQYYSHGLTIGADGNRAYVAAGNDQGLLILDTSEIQARKPNPQVREIASLTWPTMTIPQNAIPITIKGKPYVVEVDEYSASSDDSDVVVAAHGDKVGAARIIDISDETRPFVVSDLRLEVHQPEHRAEIADDPGAQNPTQGYAAHYCNVPTRVDPPIVACSMIISGLRVFDIRNPAKPREVAYFNAPVYPRETPYFEASNWAMSSPSFVPERKEIWYTDGFSGFYVVRLTNKAWPGPGDD